MFHVLTHRWFRSALGEPTAAQTRGWESIRQGRHTLIAAPTGSGKTLAAFLTALDDLFQESLRGPVHPGRPWWAPWVACPRHMAPSGVTHDS